MRRGRIQIKQVDINSFYLNYRLRLKSIKYFRLFNKVLRDKSLSENDKIEFIMNAVYENDNQNFVINYLEKNFDDFKDNLNLERILMDVSRTFVKKSQITKVKCYHR